MTSADYNQNNSRIWVIFTNKYILDNVFKILVMYYKI